MIVRMSHILIGNRTNRPGKISALPIILKQVGNLLLLLGVITAIPAFVSIIYREWYSTAGFLLSSLIIIVLGHNHALTIAATGWLVITFMGGLPFYIISHITPAEVMQRFIPTGSGYTESSLLYFRNVLHCFFESMSAYTTTGLTMTVHEPSVGKGVLFYRCFAQWIGGAGFIVLVLAVFKQLSGKGALLLYGSETKGEKLRPRLIETTRSIWKVYLIITTFSFVYLVVGTHIILPDYPLKENLFDSLNHAMSGQSTGGFSTLDDSIAGYHSPYMDMLYLLPMILGSFSMPFYFKVIFQGKFGEFWKDIQTRSLLFAFFFGSVIQAYLLWHADTVPNPIREGIFQFVSGMSTTGWQTSNIGNWDWLSVVFIVSVGMFVGGASGATVGGIKMIRVRLLEKGLRWQVNKTFLSPNTVKTIKFNGKSMSPDLMNEEFTNAAAIAVLFFLIILVSTIITSIILEGKFSIADCLFESTSAQSTTGLSSGITDPAMSPVVEIIYILQMWVGRLEVIPVLAMFRAIFRGMDPKRI
jgi:trk system potassium uptake protein TrkH